jgi:hypothetical protein
MKRSIIISILLFAMFLVSCINKDEIGVETEISTEPVTSNETNNLDNSEYVMSILEIIDCEGHEFNFSTRRENNPEWDIWALRDIDAEIQNGEPINDAVFNRNRYLEEKFNCVINDIQSFKQQDDIKKVIMSGVNDFDVTIIRSAYALTDAADGYFYNFNNVENIHLDNPWWDSGANEAFDIMGKLYTTSGDLLIINNDAIGAFVFNKGMAEDYNIA